MISPDAPITSSQQEKLGRSSFAEAIAKAVEAFDGSESFVIGVHGPWGMGKSSLLNLVEEAIRIRSEGVSEEKRIYVLRFNPWNFADRNYLVLQFLGQLSAHLRTFEKWHKRKLKGLVESVDEYANALAGPLEAAPYGRPMLGGFRLALAWGRKALRAGKDAEQLYRSVEERLAELKRKTVVIIDDIDRLNAPEIRQVFQLVKATARFPYVVYILAFDKEAVSRALADEGTKSGEEYLEKIVQVGFDLPPVPEATLTSFLTSGLDELLQKYPPAHFDMHRFGNLFHSGFRSCFSSLRHVRRFLNGMEFGFGIISKELNAVDFIGVEAIRTFYPATYDVVRSNKGVFAGHIDFNTSEAGPDAFTSRVDSLLKATGEVDAVKDLLVELFPKLEYAYGHVNHGAESEDQWEKEYRIGTERYFDSYFQLTLPPGDVSVGEIDQAILAASGQAALEEKLRAFLASRRIVNALSSIRHRLDDIPKNHLPSVCGALVEIGDSVEHEGSPFFRNIPEYWHVRWAIFDVLERMPHGNRFEVLEGIFARSRAVATVTDLVVLLAKLKDEKKDKYPDLSDEVLQRMTGIAVQRLRVAAEDSSLLTSPYLGFNLAWWARWGDAHEAKEYAASVLTDPEKMPRCVKHFVYEQRSAGMGDKVACVKKNLAAKALAELVDLTQLRESLEALDTSRLPATDAEAVQFVKDQLRQLIDSGLTPEQFQERQSW